MQYWRLLILAFLVTIDANTLLPEDRQIKVGDNKQVSAANSELLHLEPVADVDPDDPQHLIVCSEILGTEPDPGNQFSGVIYASFDGGRSWAETLRARTMHPSCAFGHGGVAYFTVEARESSLYRSSDGGRHWTKTATYPSSDHPYLNVDNANKAYGGQVYISARNADYQVHTGVTLYSFTKDGDSLGQSVSIYSSGEHFTPIMGSATVMADGTFALIFPELMKSPLRDASERPSEGKNAWIKVSFSADRGKTLEPPSIVATINLRWDARSPALQFGIAADTTNGPFRNRLYVAWQEKKFRRYRIWLSHSDDLGKTWSEPVTVDDSPPRPNALDGPDDFEPAIAVNNQGVLGVLWYDRRDSPDDLGWYARFTASLDGGDTFLPSVLVSSAPMSFSGRHRTTFNWHFDKTVQESAYAASYTVGFAAGSDGVFHAAWVDNRTGNWQIWMAPINVSGTALRNGSPELGNLVDVSSKTLVHIGNPYWDWSTGEFECDLFVKNISPGPINGPLKMRLLRLDSEVGIFNEAKFDGLPVHPGSVVEVSREGLKPGSWSKPLHFTAKVTVLFGLHDPDVEERLQKIFTIDSRTFAHLDSQ